MSAFVPRLPLDQKTIEWIRQVVVRVDQDLELPPIGVVAVDFTYCRG